MALKSVWDRHCRHCGEIQMKMADKVKISWWPCRCRKVEVPAPPRAFYIWDIGIREKDGTITYASRDVE